MTGGNDTGHRWTVDGIEEGMARVEADGGVMLTVPLWLLPASVRERQVLSVTRTGGAGSSVVTITVDDSATSSALAASKASVEKIARESKKRDAGGDVAL